MGCKDVLDQAVEGSPVTRLQQYAQILKPLCVHALFAGSGAVLRKGLYTLYPCIYTEMDKDGVFLTTPVLPLTIKYSVVATCGM